MLYTFYILVQYFILHIDQWPLKAWWKLFHKTESCVLSIKSWKSFNQYRFHINNINGTFKGFENILITPNKNLISDMSKNWIDIFNEHLLHLQVFYENGSILVI